VTLGKNDAETQALLVQEFRILDPQGCSVRDRDGYVVLEGTCPFVRSRVCDANVELVELSIEARHWLLGRRVGEAVMKNGDCDPATFERLLARVADGERS
jgi:hypothetical protein